MGRAIHNVTKEGVGDFVILQPPFQGPRGHATLALAQAPGHRGCIKTGLKKKAQLELVIYVSALILDPFLQRAEVYFGRIRVACWVSVMSSFDPSLSFSLSFLLTGPSPRT